MIVSFGVEDKSTMKNETLIYLLTKVGLYVCVSVSKIMQNLLDAVCTFREQSHRFL